MQSLIQVQFCFELDSFCTGISYLNFQIIPQLPLEFYKAVCMDGGTWVHIKLSKY